MAFTLAIYWRNADPKLAWTAGGAAVAMGILVVKTMMALLTARRGDTSKPTSIMDGE